MVNVQKLKRDWVKENLLHGVWGWQSDWKEKFIVENSIALVCQQHSTISNAFKHLVLFPAVHFKGCWINAHSTTCCQTNPTFFINTVFLMKDSERFLLSFSAAAPSKAFISFDLLLSMQQRLIYTRKMSNLIAHHEPFHFLFSCASFQVQSHNVQCFSMKVKKWSFVIAFTWQSIFNHLFSSLP